MTPSPQAAGTGADEWARAYAGRRVLVLGASGFIGRWVARGLVRAGARLELAVRDVEVATRTFERWKVIGHVLWRDFAKPGSVTDLVRETRPEVVFNLAGYGIDHGEREDPLYRRINTDLVRELGEILAELPREPSRAAALPRLIHAGSALEYGTVSGELDEAGPARPTTTYGRTKLAGTRALIDVAAGSGLACVIARLFTVYGPGEHRGRLLPALLHARSTDEALPLTRGDQLRDFTYVEDVAEGLLRLGAAAGAPGEVVNLATGVLTPVRTFVEQAARELALSPDRLRFGALPTRGWEQHHTPLTLARLRARTGWSPAASIVQGVRRTLAFEDGRDPGPAGPDASPLVAPPGDGP